jgi:hypothetical protein
MMGAMRRNLIAGLLIAGVLVLMATSLPALGLVRTGPPDVAIQPIPALGEPLSPPHQHPKFLPGIGSTGAGPSQVVAYLSVPKLGIKNAQIFDRGVDGTGNMLIAKGYAVTHYANSSPIGSGNAVLYGHDDIEGSIFGRRRGRLPRVGAGDCRPDRGRDPAAHQRRPVNGVHVLAQLGGQQARCPDRRARHYVAGGAALVVRLFGRPLKILQ